MHRGGGAGNDDDDDDGYTVKQRDTLIGLICDKKASLKEEMSVLCGDVTALQQSLRRVEKENCKLKKAEMCTVQPKCQKCLTAMGAAQKAQKRHMRTCDDESKSKQSKPAETNDTVARQKALIRVSRDKIQWLMNEIKYLKNQVRVLEIRLTSEKKTRRKLKTCLRCTVEPKCELCAAAINAVQQMWSCRMCTYNNKPDSRRCEVCDELAPQSPPGLRPEIVQIAPLV